MFGVMVVVFGCYFVLNTYTVLVWCGLECCWAASLDSFWFAFAVLVILVCL